MQCKKKKRKENSNRSKLGVQRVFCVLIESRSLPLSFVLGSVYTRLVTGKRHVMGLLQARGRASRGRRRLVSSQRRGGDRRAPLQPDGPVHGLVHRPRNCPISRESASQSRPGRWTSRRCILVHLAVAPRPRDRPPAVRQFPRSQDLCVTGVGVPAAVKDP